MITMLAVSVLVTSLIVMPTGASPLIRAGAPQWFGGSAAQASPATGRNPCDQGRGEVDRRDQSRHHPAPPAERRSRPLRWTLRRTR